MEQPILDRASQAAETPLTAQRLRRRGPALGARIPLTDGVSQQ